MKHFTPHTDLKPEETSFAIGTDRFGKPQINMFIGADASAVAFVTPACVTNWPRVTGDGNYGTMWGPTDIQKAKFTLDLTDAPINEERNTTFEVFADLLNTIDDRLLDFVQANQLKILGRLNLSREEIKMLQIRSVRPKYDKISGVMTGKNVQLSAPKFAYDGCGGKYPRTINVCDHTGVVIPHGVVQPGDVVAATMFANQVYTGVGGDKFGIHWSFEDVQVICQRSKLAQKTSVPSFGHTCYSFAMPYAEPVTAMDMDTTQFSDPISVQ